MAEKNGSGWAGKSALERVLLEGVYGTPELRAEERARYLGELAERVLASLTKKQVEAWVVDEAVAKAAADPRAKGMLIHGDIPFPATTKYRKLAEEHGLTVTMRSDPSYEGEVGLVVVSDEAV